MPVSFKELLIIIAAVPITLIVLALALGYDPFMVLLGFTITAACFIILTTAVSKIFSSLSRLDERHLSQIDPHWPAKAAQLERRLQAAVYQWQPSEFGAASKAFSLPVSLNVDEITFGVLVIEERCDERKIELEPTEEALERLHIALRRIILHAPDEDLAFAMIARGKISIDTTFGRF